MDLSVLSVPETSFSDSTFNAELTFNVTEIKSKMAVKFYRFATTRATKTADDSFNRWTIYNDSYLAHRPPASKQMLNIAIGKHTSGYLNIDGGGFDYEFPDPDNVVSIGRYTTIGDKVTLYIHPSHCYQTPSTFPFHIRSRSLYRNELFSLRGLVVGNLCLQGGGNIRIGSDVRIGSNVLIMSGVTIGDGAILGDSSVIRKNVEPYSIVIGNPARHYKYRFRPEEIEELLRVKWWEWSDEEIDDNLDAFLHDNDVHAFLIRAKQVMHNRNRTDLLLGLSELVSE